MKIIAISDLHGDLPVIDVKANIAVVAGDISPLHIQFNKLAMKEWLKNDFMQWVKHLDVEKVYLVAGNHDAVFEFCSNTLITELSFLSSQKLIYLKNNSSEYIDDEGKTWNIFGTPYCHQFGNWPFMRSEEVLEEKFKSIPETVDIIVSHDPPFGIGWCDCILENPRSSSVGPEHHGNYPLRKQLEKTKFKWLFCGHIHSGDHRPVEFMDGKVVNVSLNNERYNSTYEPFIIEIEK